MELNLVPVASVIGVGVVRSIGGWLDNALEDGKITPIEWGQLGATVVRVGLVTGALYYGINGIFGTDITVIAAGAGAFVADWIVKKIKSNRTE